MVPGDSSSQDRRYSRRKGRAQIEALLSFQIVRPEFRPGQIAIRSIHRALSRDEAARIQKFGQSTITAFHVTTQTIEQPQCAA
jgi:hypothetical protein